MRPAGPAEGLRSHWARRVRLFTAPVAVHGGGPLLPAGLRLIEETAELVTAAGGRGIAVRVDHTKPADVKKLVAGIKRRHKGLDTLVNDVWGGDALTEFGKTFWTVNLDNGPRKMRSLQAGRSSMRNPAASGCSSMFPRT